MTRVGTLTGAYRYPIKSMLGEALEEVVLGELGVEGDRRFGVRDETRGDFMTGKRVGALMGCRARWIEDEAPEIELPDGTRFRADAPEANARLSELLGRKVSICPVGGAPAAAAAVDQADSEADQRAMMARVEGEPEPDFSDIPAPLMAFAGRPDRPYVDLSPLLLLSEQSMGTIARAAPDSKIDVRRFRPSLLIDASTPGDFPELDWIGRRVRVGEVVLSVEMPCVRCVMTTHAFADLPKDPAIMRRLVSEADGRLGVYASLERHGRVRVGDAIELLDQSPPT